MKRQVRIILFTASIITLLWSCAKNDNIKDSLSLRQSFDQGALNLNKAMDAIASSKAFGILTVNDGTAKSVSTESAYKVYINLDSIKGEYNYHPGQKKDRWGKSLLRYFDKTANNSKMIVRVPLKKIQHPRSLRDFVPADTLLTNNFSISVSAYHNNYNSYHDFDYILASEIGIDNVAAGNLNIKYVVSPTLGVDYASQYAFTGSYTADYKYESGDTTVSSFGISGSNKLLYEEKRLTIKSDTGKFHFGREHQYILTIGDVKLVRKSATKTVQVYVNSVLQPNAKVEIIDKEADDEASVCKHREIQITFEDGTVTTVSALIGKSVDNIKTLFDSLHDVYFAAYVVDWIAYDIYYQRH
jgi:hypothetical protein